MDTIGLQPALLTAAALFLLATAPPFVLHVFDQMNRTGPAGPFTR